MADKLSKTRPHKDCRKLFGSRLTRQPSQMLTMACWLILTISASRLSDFFRFFFFFLGCTARTWTLTADVVADAGDSSADFSIVSIRYTDRRTDRQTDRQTDRLTDSVQHL